MIIVSCWTKYLKEDVIELVDTFFLYGEECSCYSLWWFTLAAPTKTNLSKNDSDLARPIIFSKRTFISIYSLANVGLVVSLASRWYDFGSRVYPRGSLVIALVCGPSLNISETVHWFFLIFCMKLVYHKGTKATEPDFWKKSWGVANGGKTPNRPCPSYYSGSV